MWELGGEKGDCDHINDAMMVVGNDNVGGSDKCLGDSIGTYPNVGIYIGIPNYWVDYFVWGTK